MFYNFSKMIESLLILAITAGQLPISRASYTRYTEFRVDSSTLHWDSNFMIYLASKNPNVPMLLMTKKSSNPSFYFNSTSGYYEHDVDDYDFDAWSRNKNASVIILPKNTLKEGDIYHIGVYSEYDGAEYEIDTTPTNHSWICHPPCFKNSQCNKNDGKCYCDSRENLGDKCDAYMTIAPTGKNTTSNLTSDEWKFYYFDTWKEDFTIDIYRNLGEPEFYFQNLSKDSSIKGFLPGPFDNNFTLVFGENDTIKYSNSTKINSWAYGVHCPKGDDCTFSIKIDKDSSDDPGFIITWLIPLCVIVGLPFLGLVFCVCRKSCQRVDELKEATKVVKEKEKCLTSDEMDDYFPEMQWDIFGKEYNMCSFCSLAFENWEKARMLNCRHIFHIKCIDRWSRVNGFCPICKQKLIEDKDRNIEDSEPPKISTGSKINESSSKSIDQKDIVLSEKEVKDKKIDEAANQMNKANQNKVGAENQVRNENEDGRQEIKQNAKNDNTVKNEMGAEGAVIKVSNTNEFSIKPVPISKSKDEEIKTEEDNEKQEKKSNIKKFKS